MNARRLASASTPIRLGGLAPLSRPGFFEAGRHLRAGIELAVAEINDAGGIDGRLIDIQIHDSAGSPERAVGAIRGLADSGAVAVVGEYHSVVARAVAAAAVDAQLPFVCSSAVLDRLVSEPTDIVARLAPPQSYCWQIYADYLVAAGHKRVAVVVQPDAYWSAGEMVLRDALEMRGVSTTRFDVTALADQAADVIASTDAFDSALLLVAYPEPVLSIVKSLRVDPRLGALLIGDPAGRAECAAWLSYLGAAGANVPFLRYLPSMLEPLGARVFGRLKHTLGETPSFVALEGYDSVQVVAEALRLGGGERCGVISALGDLDVLGTRGRIAFAKTAGPTWQWAWPPVQIAVHDDPENPGYARVLRQAPEVPSTGVRRT